jgi:hypothetical protein
MKVDPEVALYQSLTLVLLENSNLPNRVKNWQKALGLLVDTIFWLCFWVWRAALCWRELITVVLSWQTLGHLVWRLYNSDERMCLAYRFCNN